MEFKRKFEFQLNEIEKNITDGDVPSQNILKCIDSLQTLVKNSVNELTTFDQEKYETSLQKARERVWKRSKPTRFKFKSSQSFTRQSPGDTTVRRQSSERSENATTNAAKSSKIIYASEPKTNLNVADLTNSIVISPKVEGSVYITRVDNSKVLIECQQCRIHECVDTDIYLEQCATPIIEHCKNIKFIVPSGSEVTVSDFTHLNPAIPNMNYTIEYVDPPKWKPISSYLESDAISMKKTMMHQGQPLERE